MSAAEMKCFVLSLSLMIADFIPRKNMPTWKLYLLLRQTVCIALKPSIYDNDIELIGKLVKDHHTLYIKLFGNTLKPKHHFMLHYSFIMRIIGPLVNTWAMRLEAKHRPVKQGGSTSQNRINLPKTMAIKHQLALSEIFLKTYKIKINTSYKDLRPGKYPVAKIPQINYDNYCQIENAVIKNIKYNIDDVIKLSADEMPVYGRICNIFRNITNLIETNFAFIVEIFKSVKSNYSIQSFRLQNMKKYEFVFYNSLLFIEPRSMVILADGMPYISYDNYML